MPSLKAVFSLYERHSTDEIAMRNHQHPSELCKFCRSRPADVDSHIIPRSFVLERSVLGAPNFLLSNKLRRKKRTPTGVYDSNLVCAICEATFGNYDTYGHRFFHREQMEPVYVDGELFMYQHNTANVTKLKLFFLTILWRASASAIAECRAVNLSRWEPDLRQMIKTGDCGVVDRFPVVLEKFDNPTVTPLVYPYVTNIAGVLCYKMELGGCAAVVAIQGRELPQVLIDIALAPGRPVYLLAKEYGTSKERQRTLDTFRKVLAAEQLDKVRRGR
jgi:hypothetical protein